MTYEMASGAGIVRNRGALVGARSSSICVSLGRPVEGTIVRNSSGCSLWPRSLRIRDVGPRKQRRALERQ